MHNFLVSNGATILEQSDSAQVNEDQAIIVLVPHSTPAAEVQKLQFDLPIRTRIVSEWWVEKCLHEKTLIDELQTPLSQPLQTVDIPGFDRLIICPTSFSGIDLLHLSKAVKLMGMSRKTSNCNHLITLSDTGDIRCEIRRDTPFNDIRAHM